MSCGVIRVDEMAVERVAVLRGLVDKGVIEALQDVVVTEEELVNGGMQQLEMMTDAGVVFVAVPGKYAGQLTTHALRLGKHVFLGRAALPGISECKEMAALGEEAGVELGISRLMRFHPFLQRLPAGWRATALSVCEDSQDHDAVQFQQMLEDAIDICCNLAGTGEVRKVEAQLVKNGPAHPGSLMVGFRFQNGTYAQIQLRQGVARPRHIIYAGGGSFEIEVDLIGPAFFIRHQAGTENKAENESARLAFESESLPRINLVEKETTAFIRALTQRIPVPVSIFDGLQTLRLVEAIRKNLR